MLLYPEQQDKGQEGSQVLSAFSSWLNYFISCDITLLPPGRSSLFPCHLLPYQWHNKVFTHVPALTLPYQCLITALSSWKGYFVQAKAEGSSFYTLHLQERPQTTSWIHCQMYIFLIAPIFLRQSFEQRTASPTVLLLHSYLWLLRQELSNQLQQLISCSAQAALPDPLAHFPVLDALPENPLPSNRVSPTLSA